MQNKTLTQSTPVSNTAQRNFSGGEIAPALYGRTDEAKYASGVRLCRNLVVQRHGGLVNRAGTQFVCEVKDSTKKVRLIEFIFNASQTYMLEFGDFYMRVMRLGVQVTVTTPVFPWTAGVNFAVNDTSSVGGINYVCLQANFSAAGNAPGNVGFWYQITGVIYEIPTPYAVADLPLLQYVQSADVITIVHPLYAPRELKRTGDAKWTLGTITLGPVAAIPTGPMAIGGGSADPVGLYWAVTSIKNGTFEESLPLSTVKLLNVLPSVGTPSTVQWPWNAATDAYAYNIYRSVDGVTFGKIGSLVNPLVAPLTGNLFFSDTGVVPDFLNQPPVARNILNAANAWPSAVCFYQQRRMFANTINEPEKVFASKTGFYYNFGVHFPVQTDDAVTWSLSGQQINAVQFLIDIGQLVVFTTDGEWNIDGDQSGILRPGSINPKQYSYHGANALLKPIIIGNVILYVQARGTIVRNIEPDYFTRFKGKDMTIYSSHLFEGFSLVSWAFQEQPSGIMWAVRSDGVLIALTYIPEQDVWGWHHHDTDGLFECVNVIPENTEDKVYLCVNRTINGVTKRYIEYMNTRFITDIKYAMLVDCGLTYDGTNFNPALTMTLTGGVTWDGTELMTLTTNNGLGFSAGDVNNNQVFLRDASGAQIVFTILGYTSGFVVTGRTNKAVPATLQGIATTSFTKAVRTFSGLTYLEGKNVSALGDGFVVASPNNAAYPLYKVVGGQVTFDQPYGVMRIGLPYTSDLMTLDIDTASGPSLKDKLMNVNKVILAVKDTRGVWAGTQPPTNDLVDPLQGLAEYKPRTNTDPSLPVSLLTDIVTITTESSWNDNGRVFVRQVDPLPINILAAIPSGFIP